MNKFAFGGIAALGFATLTLASGSLMADVGHGKIKTSSIGEPGYAAAVSRAVEVDLFDNYFTLENITVKEGETIRFIITNKGDLVHEFNIGTAASQLNHQKEMEAMMVQGALETDNINRDRMKMNMGGRRTMAHDDPNSVLLEPGKASEAIWKFSAASGLEFACNVPGHYESGMVGKFRFL